MKQIDDQNNLTIVQKVAGGGKTTLLLEYVHKASVDWKYSKQDVWAITYAKKLANELTEKSRGQTRSGTVHSFALRLVKQHYRVLGFSKKPGVLKDFEDRQLFVDLAKQHKLTGKAEELDDSDKADKLAERLHREHYGRCVDLVTAAGSLGVDSPAVEFNNVFHEEKKQRAVLSYQDMIRLANKLFQIYPDASKHLDLPKVLLVDEYQDLNLHENK